MDGPGGGDLAISVQIPSRGRAELLARCVGALARQSLEGCRYEVVIGLDGPDDEAQASARRAWTERPAQNLRVEVFPREGHLPIRRALVGMTRARLIVFMNDDVVAEEGFLEAHLSAHREAEARGVAVMVAGRTPWAVGENDTLFDVLVRETSLVFFSDAMEARSEDRWRDWGFRHFWTLNASAPREAVERVGGVRAIPRTYGHEDIELAFRMQRRLGMAVVYRPEACAVHHHRYRPADVMIREMRLGAASWRFARESPEFGTALFGRDVTCAGEIAYSREFVERERASADRLARDFEALGDLRIGVDVDRPGAGLLGILSRQFLLLKRHLWRRGLLEAAGVSAGEPAGVG